MDEDNVDDIVQMLENKKSFTGKRLAQGGLMAFMTEDQKLFLEYHCILIYHVRSYYNFHIDDP